MRNYLPIIFAKESSWIAYVDSVALFTDYHDNYDTWTAFVKLISFGKFSLNKLNKFSLNFVNSLYDCFFGILREVLIIDDVLMKIVSEKIATSSSTVTIINSEKCGFNPLFIDIKNYTDPIFIVISRNTLMSVYCVWFDKSTFFEGGFGIVNFGDVLIGRFLELLFVFNFIGYF